MNLVERSDLARWMAAQLVITIAESLLLAGFVLWLLLSFGRSVSFLDTWAVSLVAMTTIRMQRLALPGTGARRRRRTANREDRDAWTVGPGSAVLGRPANDPISPLPETLDRRFRRLARHADRLTYAVVETRHFESGVRPVLTDLAADRLRRHHGIDMAADPLRAHEMVGDDLWQALTIDRSQPPTAADLERWVTTLEQIGAGDSTARERLLPT